jgi:hypothetical protein
MGIKILVVVTILTILFVANLLVNRKYQKRYKKR